MISRILKHIIQKIIISTDPDGPQSEMNLAVVDLRTAGRQGSGPKRYFLP